VGDSTELQVYRRTTVVAILFLGAVAFGVGHLGHLQATGGLGPAPPELSVVHLPALRGNIYDRHGYLMAVSGAVYDIGASPPHVTDSEMLADRLAPLLGSSRDELLGLLKSDSPYVQLQRGVSADLWAEIKAWEEGGLQADSRPSRIYPNGSLAACVLGFVNDDGQAAYGLETYYDHALSGEAGERWAARDALGSISYQFRPPRDGADLYLTLDRNVQYILEEALSRAITPNEANKGVAVLMEPATGAVLGLAVLPSYDPNTREVDSQGVFTNFAISEHYEPGSVFKIVTVAAALDAGLISPESTYYDSGVIAVGGEPIENSDRQAHGETSMHELLAHSLNVGAATLSTRLGAFAFYDYVRRFGFAEVTGIDLAYEIPGEMRLPGDREWHESDLGTNSFGQGLAATPIQVLCAVSSVANGGVLMRPHIVGHLVQDNKVTEVVPEAVRRVISPEAAAQVTEMLVYAVDHVLTQAAVAGYRVAGKSGTAQVATPLGYDPEETIASFAGYFPADDPRFALLVTLHQPHKEQWGSKAAAPIFHEIAQRVLELYAVPPDAVRASMHMR
jgi:cell division protein FtsI/penicillin-binding protein 2